MKNIEKWFYKNYIISVKIGSDDRDVIKLIKDKNYKIFYNRDHSVKDIRKSFKKQKYDVFVISNYNNWSLKEQKVMANLFEEYNIKLICYYYKTPPSIRNSNIIGNTYKIR